MPITLGYWDLRGIAEPIRALLKYVEVPFEDKLYKLEAADMGSVSREKWFQEKFTLGLDFPNLPWLIDGDVKITQSLTILRYLGRKFELDAKNEAERIRLDLAEQAINDMRVNMFRVAYSFNDYEQQFAMYAERTKPQVKQLDQFLGNGKWILGDRLTYVDFLMYEAVDFFRLFDVTLLDDCDNLIRFLDRFEAIPQMQKHYKSDSFDRWGMFAPFAAFKRPAQCRVTPLGIL